MRVKWHVKISVMILPIGVSLSMASEAAEGIVEINQSCAVSTGCFAGDSPGSPVTINHVVTNNVTGGITGGVGVANNNRNDEYCAGVGVLHCTCP